MSHKCTKSIKHETFERVIVKRSERVGTIKSMMNGMNVLIEKLIDMKGSMPKVLPCVHDEPDEKV